MLCFILALDLLLRLADKPAGNLKGHEKTVEYLQKLGIAFPFHSNSQEDETELFSSIDLDQARKTITNNDCVEFMN